MEDSDHQSVAVIDSSDLLSEIFIRLPITSILRFKSVCKHWRLLLSHKHFTHWYDNNNNFSKSVGILTGNIYVPFDVENSSPSPFRDLDFYFNRSNVRIRQSCNGLLLCSAYHNWDNEYYVFNPTTKQLAFIPSVPKYISSIVLAYDQTHCVHYKVVCICGLDPIRFLCRIQVYSSDTKKWKICAKYFFVPGGLFFDPVIYCNGAFYWPPHYRRRRCLCFEIDDEQLRTLPLPERLVSDDLVMYMGESRGHLHLILRKDQEPNISIMNVYEMLMDRSGWFVKYRVRFDELPGFPEMFDYDSGVVDVVRGKEEEETFLVMRVPGKMIRYNVHNKSVRELSNNNALGWNREVHVMGYVSHRYIERLSSF